ncbi:MAG: MFS transporter [Proteobacteria bacterium]|nr:MFS transporter [Pseudomonadota bacterium]
MAVRFEELKMRNWGFNRWYVLGVLTLVYAFNIADRYVISTLIEPIKASLHLSDSAVGFLTGTALAVVYTGMGFPLALLADRSNRRNLLAASIALWSTMTAACGMAGSFLPLLVARIGVGVGEAGATPGSQSMVGDLFNFKERLFANAVFAVGAAVGSMLGGTVGGTISDAFGWRSAFYALAIPSLLLAPLVMLTVREPKRGMSDPRAVVRSGTTVAELLAFARGQPALLHALAGVTICTLWSWGMLWWTPAYLARSHGMSTGEAGMLLGIINGVGGTLGVLVGGYALQRVGRSDPRRQCWTLAAIVACGTVASFFVYAAHSRLVLIGALCAFVPVAYVYLSPAFGWIQSLSPPHMRASFCATHLFGANIANLAIAPSLVGFFSDRLAPRLGAESLRYVLIVMALTGFWAAYHFWAVSKRFTQDLVRAGADVGAG